MIVDEATFENSVTIVPTVRAIDVSRPAQTVDDDDLLERTRALGPLGSFAIGAVVFDRSHEW